MAYKDSETIQSGTAYALGDYTFNCVFDDSPTLGQYARASMSKDGEIAYKVVSLPNAVQIEGWTVEANETEATVYAVVKTRVGEDEKTSDLVPVPINIAEGSIEAYNNNNGVLKNWFVWEYEHLVLNLGLRDVDNYLRSVIYCSASPGVGKSGFNQWERPTSLSNVGVGQTYTYDNKTVYFYKYTSGYAPDVFTGPVNYRLPYSDEALAWTAIYGTAAGDEYETKEIMVGRFAIDIEDAGGVGPGGGTGGGWTDPEDYDEDWEEGDPTHTLYVTVTGALSGRHNDPIVDPSYSYIPADKDTVKDYGCGGDGGHGGGGGAGASTVVIHKFATNQANSKEVTAIARRHGYGSGGGKGGKGGDGCILVYY